MAAIVEPGLHTAPLGSGFREARRVLAGWTAGAEKRALVRLAAGTPAVISSDHLTFLGLAAMAACGVCYAMSARAPWLLFAATASLALNWLGDSLDGTLARHRHCERPRFGFYVDHLADAFGALLVLGGLALSGWMSPLVAAVVLVSYFLLAIESYLAAYVLGTFKISWGPVGGTELRIALALLNLAVFLHPRLAVAGRSLLVFDVLGLAASGVLVALAVVAGLRGTRALARIEGWAPRGR